MDINKADFFQDLDRLGCISDDSHEGNDFSGLMKIAVTSKGSNDKQLNSKVRNISSSSVSSTGANGTMGKHSTSGADKLHEKHDKNSTKRPAENTPSKGTKGSKKQRAKSSQTIPEADQIFKGLKFFFIPNNDISPARRLRIQRSQDYGALWAQTWSSDITHVIVDKGLDYKELLKVLTPEQLSGNIAIVNQDYVSDCLVFKSILSITQIRFRVDGSPTAPSSEKVQVVTDTSPDSSLPIKESRRQRHQSVTSSSSEDMPLDNAAPVIVQQEVKIVEAHQLEGRKPDLLDELMLKVKEASDLPLEDSDIEEALDITDTNSEAENSKEKSGSKVPEWQKKFSCMEKHDGTGMRNNPNAKTIETLQKMANYYSRIADNWRTIAYRKAIAALRKYDTKVSTKAQALAIPGIGERLADKIEEIVSTNRLQRLENINSTPEDRALQLFLDVYGVGYAQASKWVAKGYRSLEDLQTKADLTASQKIGVERYSDFQQRIPRAEVTLHGDIVRAAILAVDPDMEVIVAGSYRRGVADCGDIDVLITKPTGTLEYIRALLLDTIVPTLTKKGFLKISLATSSRGDGSKWHGASALPGTDIWRRIDLLFVPGSEIGAALLYFTGNDIFNRSLRLLARKKGMRLNQRGLYKDVLRGPNQTKVTTGSLLEGRDEKRMLEILGVPWRPPEHRIC